MWNRVIFRHQRRWIAAALTCVLAFAGAMTAAHACAVEASVAQAAQSVAPSDPAMAEDCGGMADGCDATANLCEAHCVVGQQVDAQAAAPAALVAPQQPLRVGSSDRRLPAIAVTPMLLATIEATPPPLLRFARFLI
jgi:hypothetical protein